MSRPKKSLSETVQNEMPEFAAEVAGLSVQDLNTRLANSAKALEMTLEAKDMDKGLEDARALASELAAPYRDSLKANRLKARYLISLIKQKGGDL